MSEPKSIGMLATSSMFSPMPVSGNGARVGSPGTCARLARACSTTWSPTSTTSLLPLPLTALATGTAASAAPAVATARMVFSRISDTSRIRRFVGHRTRTVLAAEDTAVSTSLP